jgi:hypothetical protein
MRLSPSRKWTPAPFEYNKIHGYEAQTFAEYCGDLFVGYWPKGEIWRYSRVERKWVYFRRLFTESSGEEFYPWSDRPLDDLDRAFFGQRVTSLIPLKDSLYAVTSNLNGWHADLEINSLTSEQVDEYGALWEIKGVDCYTVYD